MISFFKKLMGVSEAEDTSITVEKEQVEKEQEVMPNIGVYMYSLMIRYINQPPAVSFSDKVRADYQKVKERYDRLEKQIKFLTDNEMRDTKNYTMYMQELNELKPLYVKLEDDVNYVNAFPKLPEMVRKIKESFGEQAILMGVSQFFELLDKFNLKVGFLQDYTGLIPEKNMADIIRVKAVVHDDYRLKYSLGIGDTKYEYINDDTHTLMVTRTRNSSLIWGHHILIACPESELREQSYRMRDYQIDPLVFQMCKYGVIIYTAWGDEIESEIYKKYKEANDVISSLSTL